jgi:hypothetical protein
MAKKERMEKWLMRIFTICIVLAVLALSILGG